MISLHEGRGAEARKTRRSRVQALHLTVAGLQPRIWRRLLVRETMWLSRLHEVIQVLFGWYDYQTHLFLLGDKRYGNPMNHDDVVIEDDRNVTLVDVRFSEHGRLTYDYLFAEGWHVDIRVEKTAAAEKGVVYPKCVAGERAGPPEDCGGAGAYKDMLYCLKHPETDLGHEWREWLGPDYDPEQCDLAAINKALRQLGK
ncbi:MAG: plasmid pRiA4b ORF-3 family protein [Opitutaceae bacterium]|nr:plasmid pRiA4b ORF-3 family protein [Opitutaceae bacterium]